MEHGTGRAGRARRVSRARAKWRKAGRT